MARPMRAAVIAIAMALLGAAPLAAQAQLGRSISRAENPRLALDDPVAEAAQRFGIPPDWILAVIAAESGGRVDARSPAGAMGLMQLMPGTWAALTQRLGLGTDPYAPRANILAGTAYLRELYDRYGAPGFLAAYNAGPGRYEQYRGQGRPLPLETRAYVAQLAPRLSGEAPVPAAAPAPGKAFPPPSDPLTWTRSGLFAAVATGIASASAQRAEDTPGEAAATPAENLSAAARDLFVAPSAGSRR